MHWIICCTLKVLLNLQNFPQLNVNCTVPYLGPLYRSYIIVQILKYKISKRFFSLQQYVKGFQRFHAGVDVWPVTPCAILLCNLFLLCHYCLCLLWYASTFDSFGVLICYNLVTGNTLPKIFFPCFLEMKIRASWGYFLNSKSATLMAQAHPFFFPTKKDSKKKFNSWRIHPFFIFLKLFDSNYCDEVWRNAR